MKIRPLGPKKESKPKPALKLVNPKPRTQQITQTFSILPSNFTSYFPNSILRHLLAFPPFFPNSMASCKNLKSKISTLMKILPLSSLSLKFITDMEKQVSRKKLLTCVKRSLVVEFSERLSLTSCLHSSDSWRTGGRGTCAKTPLSDSGDLDKDTQI